MFSEATHFWLLAATLLPVAYSYAIYPVMIAGLAALAPRRTPLLNEPDESLPTVTVLVAAHNEAEVIGERIRNILAARYPAQRLEVLVASDGSTDGTESIVQSFQDERVRLLAHHPNRGKSYTLNRAIPESAGSVVVMSDANTEFDSDAIDILVRRLVAGDKPLAVCGKLVLVDAESGENADGLYWRYETWQKASEGKLAATLGANGGIYAFRRDDYCPIPDNTIIDDLTIPLLMKIRRGGAIVFEPGAIAREETAPTLADEFTRRVRIGIGDFQSLRQLYPLLNPRFGFTAMAFFSHKLLRWFTPHLIVLALLSTLAGLQWQSMRIATAAWACAAVVVWIGSRVSGQSLIARLLRLSTMFASMNAALMLGFYRWIREDQSGTWKRTAR